MGSRASLGVEWLGPASAVLGWIPGFGDVDPLSDHMPASEVQDGDDGMGIAAVEPEGELDDLHRGAPGRTVDLEPGRPG
jgi:hypothetical protein